MSGKLNFFFNEIFTWISKLARSEVGAVVGDTTIARTSESAFFVDVDEGYLSLFPRISKRISAITGLATDSLKNEAEKFQVQLLIFFL